MYEKKKGENNVQLWKNLKLRMTFENNKVIVITQLFLLIFSIVIFFYGGINNNFDFQLIAIVFLWLNNLLYSVKLFSEKIAFFIFNVTFFVFLLSRPLIDFFRGNNWAHYDIEAIQFSLNAFFMALLFMFLGALIGKKIKFQKDIKLSNDENRQLRNKWISYISILVFYICFLCSVVIETSKLFFVMRNTYEAYYSSYNFNGPDIVSILSGMLPFILCIYLATFPRKKYSYFVLISYIIASVPTLLMGQRNPIVLRFIFAIVYFVIRDYHEKNGIKWMGKFEKISLLVGAPLGVLFLGATNYLRKGTSVSFNPVNLFLDFLHKQGTSFDTVCFGFSNLKNLPFVWEKNYTFGGIIDIMKYGFISQKLFSAPGIGNNNGILMGMKSNNLAHNLAYVYRKDEYMMGNGNGSSYLLELYADYKYIGIIVFSIVLGIFLAVVVKMLRENSLLLNVFLLGILMNLFLMPRGAALGSIKIFFKPSFLAPLIGCYLAAYFFSKFFGSPENIIRSKMKHEK